MNVGGVLLSVAVFFFALYRSSHASSWRAFVWAIASLAGLLGVAVFILRWLVPGFFEG